MAREFTELTEPQAWRLIGESVERNGWIVDGLCGDISELEDLGVISVKCWQAMSDRLAAYVSDYAYPPGTQPMARAMAAYWLAIEAADDAKRAAKQAANHRPRCPK